MKQQENNTIDMADESLIQQGIAEHKHNIHTINKHLLFNYFIFITTISWFVYIINESTFGLFSKLIFLYLILYIFSQIKSLKERKNTAKGLIVMMEDILQKKQK